MTITFQAVVYKVQTLTDGGLRLTLDMPETAIVEAAALMECKRNEIALKVTVEEDKPIQIAGKKHGKG